MCNLSKFKCHSFFSSNTAQTATEYLIILSVVVIIALIVIGVFGGIPSIGGGVSDNQIKIILATGDVGITAYKQDSRETVLFMKNNLSSLIKVTSAYVGEKKCTLYPTNQTLRVGQEKEMRCFGVRSYDDGESYSYDFNITYVDTKTDATYTYVSDAKIIGEVGAGSELHTGQTDCYEGAHGATLAASCDASHVGQDGYEDGTVKSFTDLGDNVLRDDHTGLYWTSNETGDVTRAVAISTCAGLTQGGFTDWRVPNINELVSAMNSGTTGNPSPDGFWTNDAYWSSTSQSDPYYWRLATTDGYFTISRNSDASATSTRSVCVRGSTTSISLIDSPKNFVDNRDGSVSDLNTGLVWQQNDSGVTQYWNDSIAYCGDLVISGYVDWRLPTVTEAVTLIDYGSIDYDNEAFSNDHNYYFTMTTRPANVFSAYFIGLDNALVHLADKDFDVSFRARCVRDH